MLKATFTLLLLLAAQSFAGTRTVDADYTVVTGKTDKFFQKVVGAGRAAEALRADWQRDFKEVQRECGFQYIRFHGLLQDELGVYSEDKNGNPRYNFQYIDQIYDMVLANGMKPFVEFSFMPTALASNPKSIFWWKGMISPPKDPNKWHGLIHALVEHWTQRYGQAEVASWYFEVWNEPNLKDLFFTGDQADYFQLYANTADAIKSVSTAYRVGGPATAGRGWIAETIAYATKNNVPLDFIATHDYGVDGIGLDENGEQKLFLNPDPTAIIGGVHAVAATIQSSAKPTLPLHYTEWSSSYSPRDPVHDHYISAPYILSKLRGSAGYIDSMSYWTFTDNFEENGPVPSPFHGGFGMLNFQGLRKPAFYAYQFLHRLGDQDLKSNDPASWITRTKQGVQALVWDLHIPKTTESDQVFYKKDIPAQPLGDLEVKLKNLPRGTYTVSVYQVGYKINDVYADFLKLGSPSNLSREQVKTLAARNSGKPIDTYRWVQKSNSHFSKRLPLRENDVFMITLEKSR